MKKRLFLSTAVFLVLALLLPASVLAVPQSVPGQTVPHVAPITMGQSIYLENCASCHGVNGEGSFAPNIVGRNAAEITTALITVAPMSEVTLTAPEINTVAAFLQSLMLPQVTLLEPSDARFVGATANAISVSADSALSTITSVEFQTFFSNPAGFPSMRIFAQTPISPVPAPRAGAAALTDNTSSPTGLPSTAIVSIVITGTVSAVDSNTGEWQIGTTPVVVYESATTALQGAPAQGSQVRVAATRTLSPGPIVAGTIASLGTGSSPASVPTVERTFLFNGTIQSTQTSTRSAGIKTGGETWVIGGIPFRIDDANFPATIEPGIGLGEGMNSAVTVQFTTPSASVGSNIARQIFSPQTSGDIPAITHPAPVLNTELSPVNIPAASWRQFVISGIVSAANANGEWAIGNPPVFVYQSPSTSMQGAPTIGSEVRVLASRTLAPGLIVANAIIVQSNVPQIPGPPTITSAFRFNGTVEAAGTDTWTIGNADFLVDDPLTPAVIGSGIGVGSNVTVEYRFIGAPPSVPSLWSPLTLDSASGLWNATLTTPAVNTEFTGSLFLRATDNQQQVTTVVVPATLLAGAPATAPAAPTNLGGSNVSATQVDLSWTDNANDETGFRIERSVDGVTTFTEIGTVGINVTAFSDMTAPPNVTLSYRIFAFNAVGDSAASSTMTMTPDGGGGGGGGGGAPTPVELDQLSSSTGFRVDSNGNVQNSVTLTTEDGLVSLDIAGGSTILGADGNALSFISASEITELPAPPAGNAIILGYGFGPDGASFDPALILTINYDPGMLPEGAIEDELYIAFWDGSAWLSLVSTVDTGTNMVSAEVNHFTSFAVISKLPVPAPAPVQAPAPAPASVTITSPASGDIIEGDSVRLSIEFANFSLVPIGSVNAAGEGHIHYYLDVNIPTAPGQAATTAPGTYRATTDTSIIWDDLEPGRHTLGVQLVNSNHTPLDSPVTATVTITISEPTPEPVVTTEPAPSPETAAPPSPSQTNWWLIGGLIVAVIIVAGSATYYLRQRRPG